MIELDCAQLARRLGLSLAELENLRTFAPKYTIHRRQKKHGGVRLIAEPTPALLIIQRRILDRVLPALHSLRCPYVHGGVSGRNHVTHAKVHRQATHAFVVDLKSAFSHGSRDRVGAWLQFAGMTPEVTEALLDLTIDPRLGLPQGAPTSNALFNLICHELDRTLVAYAQTHQLRYTRFVDELVLSAQREVPLEERLTILELIRDTDFRVNHRKVCSFDQKRGALVVTGVSISRRRVHLSKKKRERLRTLFHRVQKGLEPTVTIPVIEGTMSQVRVVYGKKVPKRLLVPYQRAHRNLAVRAWEERRKSP